MFKQVAELDERPVYEQVVDIEQMGDTRAATTSMAPLRFITPVALPMPNRQLQMTRDTDVQSRSTASTPLSSLNDYDENGMFDMS